MTDSQNNPTGKQTGPINVQEETHFEDEIDLIDYFKVIWKRKSLILLGSVLPALIVGLILFFSPRNYKVTYVYDVRDRSIYDVRDRSIYDVRDRSIYDVRDQSGYDFKGQDTYDFRDQGGYDVSNWNLNENNYKILLDRFYDAENTGKIVTKLQENGLNKHANRINTGILKNFVDFEVWPSYVNHSKFKTINPAELEQLRQLEAQLLNMTITGRPKNAIDKISLVIRDNLEKVIPVYAVKDQLNAAARRFRAQIAVIEENRTDFELALKTDKSILAKLKNIRTPVSDKGVSNIALQFDISGKTEYLPVEYQIQATESKAIQLEERIVANEERYGYYKNLLALNEKLLAELKNKTSSYYTIQQFHSFLTALVNSYESKELKSYLNSYIKRIENRISASAPVTQNPKVYAVARGTVKRSGIVFAVSLMISIFAAFLLESIQKSQGVTAK